MFGQDKDIDPRAQKYISVEQAEDVSYWTDLLKVDEPTLRGAIQAVGDSPEEVRDYLKLRSETPTT